MLQPGWEGSLGENGYIYTYGWVPLLSTWNYHNIVHWLCPNAKLNVKKKSDKVSWVIHYNVWAMFFRQSHHKHPDRVDLKMPIPNSQLLTHLAQAKKLGPLIHNMIIHSIQRRWGKLLPCLLTSKTLHHLLLIHHPNSSSIQSPLTLLLWSTRIHSCAQVDTWCLSFGHACISTYLSIFLLIAYSSLPPG